MGVLRFPCPRCSELAPIDLATADEQTVFACVAQGCRFTKPLGSSFPHFSVVIAQHQHLDDVALRQRVVDVMTAWFFEWSAPE